MEKIFKPKTPYETNKSKYTMLGFEYIKRKETQDMENNIKLYNVIGTDDLEGTTFCKCTSYEKALNALELLENQGFDGLLDIIQDEMPVDVIEIDGVLVELED